MVPTNFVHYYNIIIYNVFSCSIFSMPKKRNPEEEPMSSAKNNKSASNNCNIIIYKLYKIFKIFIHHPSNRKKIVFLFLVSPTYVTERYCTVPIPLSKKEISFSCLDGKNWCYGTLWYWQRSHRRSYAFDPHKHFFLSRIFS